ncbi:hypothetical protein HK097_007884 [Rhizophlyctis rosea]|uniref:Polynucleotide 5'-hydroxyl-kinase GRC3 n=1 Tax=Rhizophlyctis rosea TaxID=64517 RepID=A0AAD5SIH4_9FUNG|nr:hypothetical protein HK097_007884 [Rhizophlyctis rosea]
MTLIMHQHIVKKPTVDYVSEETPMQSYLNVHIALEQIRIENAEKGLDGPKVMIVGPADVGKSSLAKILLNYAVKHGRQPVFVDLDPTEGTVAIPGTLTATSIARPIDVEDEFGASSATTGISPIAYYYGYPNITDKPRLYSMLTTRMGAVIKKKLEDPDARASGLIINTPSQFVESGGYELLENAVQAFDGDIHCSSGPELGVTDSATNNLANVILVLGHERLYSELTKKYKGQDHISVVKLAKSGGVVSRDKAYRKETQQQRIKEYFYGTSKNELSPYNSVVSFADAAIRRIGEGALAPSSALPLGMDRKVQETRVVAVQPGSILLHSILALSQAAVPETEISSEEETELVIGTNLAGFVYINEVDEAKQKLNILVPNPGRLPKHYMILGAQKWMET